MADNRDTIRFRAAGLGERFESAVKQADMDASKVLRQFVRWYIGDDGAQLPVRPAMPGLAAHPEPPVAAAAPSPRPPEPVPPVSAAAMPEAAPESPRRGPGTLGEVDADTLIANLDERAYAKLARRAKEACESLDHDVYYPVMRSLVIAGWRPPRP